MKPSLSKQAGFTLVELLVVIAVLGVLAASVLIAINPLEQLARARDAGRKSTVEQLGKAIESNNVAMSHYLLDTGPGDAASTSWITQLSTGGDVKTIPSVTTPNNTPCWSWSGLTQTGSNLCYYLTTINGSRAAYVWTNVESKAELQKCGASVTSPQGDNGPFYVYDSTIGRTCLKCPGNGGGTWVFSGVCNAVQ